ncbi:hypothetical protein V6N11_066661 [Hibiscus sabdariffa]|uniref:Uncharacterized protein n=2 Tax=Hibiscus sabdariffa TaxID=183260 RepID=A0ABR2AHL5_9ROSI
MERSEPTLVPEWLKSTGTVTGGGGNSAHHFASSSFDSVMHHGRQRNYRNSSDFDSPRHAVLDRTSSLNSRRSSSNGSLSSPVGNSSLIGGEGWTSALAEMPTTAGSSSTGSMPAPLTVASSGSGGPSVTVGLNMAEALAQAPSRTLTAPQLSVKTQRREELAIKQSKQLIPVTPSMPKGSVLNSVDKSKAKPTVRASEMNMAVKSGQQQPSLIHHGWENGVSSPTQKDLVTLTTNVNSKVTTNQHVAAVTSAPARNSNNPKHSTGEHKAAALNPIAGFTVEKRPSLAQTQSRNDFFNLLKKKTSTNTSADEEEAAFLRSLGWEENSGDDEGLTEEEINTFYQEYMKLKPTLKLHHSVQPKLAQSIATNSDGASSELGSSDSGSEA